MPAEGTKKKPNGSDFVPTAHHDTYDFINPKQFDPKGRAVLITGASKGIGKETAISFAKAGASYIAVAARSGLDALVTEVETAAQQAGRQKPHVEPLKMDVGDYSNVEACAKQVESAFGRLDILLNNAGYLEAFVPFLESSAEDWTRSYQINVFGTFHVSKAFLPLMLKSESGLKQVINVSSAGAHAISGNGGSGYRTAKLAICRFSEFIGLEYPEVLCYSVHPGGVQTELASGMGEHMSHVLVDTPQLAADTFVWLTSEKRTWLQGRYVIVTWDMEEFSKMKEVVEGTDLLKVRLLVD